MKIEPISGGWYWAIGLFNRYLHIAYGRSHAEACARWFVEATF